MVIVSGTGDEEWLAHVQSVNEQHHTCQVYFYIADGSTGLYRKEHHRQENVQWDAILGLAIGQWSGSCWSTSVESMYMYKLAIVLC